MPPEPRPQDAPHQQILDFRADWHYKILDFRADWHYKILDFRAKDDISRIV